jgi:FtsP/CotA-like multicopper oxidase with cupredoxin domain
MPMPAFSSTASPAELSGTEFTLQIAPVTVELAPNRIVSTIGYNGISPGPRLRMKEGVPVSFNVVNDTDVPEYVHFHGLLIPSDVDGSEEEGTPVVPARGKRSYRFTPSPTGTRWYHTHTMSMDDLHRGSYTGMFGFLIIEGADKPGNFDQEHYLALRDWEPYFTNQLMDNDDLDATGPKPEKPAVLDTRPPGMEVTADIFSINDKALGGGEPIRVRPGERVDALVTMDRPGVWIMGAPEDPVREGGLGIVIEYANQRRTPQWTTAPPSSWDYTRFGKPPSQPPPAEKIDMVFEKIPRGAGKFNSFTVNGRPYPHDQEFVLKQGTRYRLTFHNRTDDAHPMHLHRHQFEIAEIYGKATSGIIKDTLVVPTYGRASVDFTADQPGLTLFHCHIQHHMDYGFKALLRYA